MPGMPQVGAHRLDISSHFPSILIGVLYLFIGVINESNMWLNILFNFHSDLGAEIGLMACVHIQGMLADCSLRPSDWARRADTHGQK